MMKLFFNKKDFDFNNLPDRKISGLRINVRKFNAIWMPLAISFSSRHNNSSETLMLHISKLNTVPCSNSKNSNVNDPNFSCKPKRSNVAFKLIEPNFCSKRNVIVPNYKSKRTIREGSNRKSRRECRR